MNRCLVVLALSSWPLLTAANGQEIKKPTHTPGEVDIAFANGSTVRMILQTEAIEVQTPYGKLKIPIKDIKQIEFGVHHPEGLEKTIEEAVHKLGSSTFRERDAATAELIKIGAAAFPAVQHAAQHSTDLELTKRAKTVLQSLKQNIPARELRTQQFDTIVTPTFTLVGRIVTPSFKATADYFGDVQLQVTQLRTMRSTQVPAEITVAVDAAKYAALGGNEWLATDFEVTAKMRLGITATGQVDLLPQQGAQFVCSPKGHIGNIVNAAAGRIRCAPGALIGRIGETGTPFLIGESHEETATAEGKLYLQIAPSAWNAQSSGSFQVRIAAKF